MRIIFIRHGESIGNVEQVIYGNTDYALTQKGQDQSEGILQQLKQEQVDGVFSSPLKRAKYLAALIAADHSLQVQTDHRISEMHYGVFEGLTPQVVEEQYGDIYLRYLAEYEHYIIPGGEGYFQFRERVYEFLKQIVQQEGTYVVVTHSGVIRESLLYLLNLNHEQIWHFKIEPACKVQISYHNNYGILEKLQ